MEILILSLLILLNGFFALSEIALVSSKPDRLQQAAKDGSKGAGAAMKLLKNPDSFLSAIQVGITLIGIVTGVYGGMNLADDFTPFFRRISWTEPYAYEIALTLTVVIITYVSIVFGELVPKTMALSKPEKTAIKVAQVILIFSQLFYPFVKLLSGSTGFINRLLGIRQKEDAITEAELRNMLKNASLVGVIEKEQKIIHDKLFYFSDKRARHFMTHRTEVEWIDLNSSAEEIKKLVTGFRHSKVVCCMGNIDNFAGFFYQREFFRMLNDSPDFNLSEIIVEPAILPESAHSSKVLTTLRQDGDRICFIVNEYGGFEGIITLHDMIESLLGQFPDFEEKDDRDVFQREDGSWLVGGDVPADILTELIENFDVDFEETDYSTVAGFVIDHLGKIPETGDKFSFMGYTVEIMDMDGNRIDKVLISADQQKSD